MTRKSPRISKARFQTDEQLAEVVRVRQQCGSHDEAARALGCVQSVVSRALKLARERGLYRERGGSIEVLQGRTEKAPAKGDVRRYILTCAQDHTKIHKAAWANLLAFAEHYDAQIMVSTFKYNKSAMGQQRSAKFDSRQEELESWYPAEIIPYVTDERVNLAKALTFCGELNIIPTAVDPLSGLESYTYRQTAIIPHPKVEQLSVPGILGEGVKMLYTTGCITLRNYIKRKEGFKAEQFHTYGGLLVEIDDAGRWFCRHLIQGDDGTMYDLEYKAEDGEVITYVTKEGGVAAIIWGDVHASKVDKKVADVSWGRRNDSILEVLRPADQFVHDLVELSPNHHARKDPHESYRVHVRGEWSAGVELQISARVLWNDIARPWCNTIVVDSNHDRHLTRMIKEVDWRDDLTNAERILSLNLYALSSIRLDIPYNVIEHALRNEIHMDPKGFPFYDALPVRFLKAGESCVVLRDVKGGTECGLHGSEGTNGTKGTLEGFARMARRVIFADKHSAARKGHAMCVPTSSELDMGYNKRGLSTWTQGHGIVYPNNTATLLSIIEGRWRAA